MSKIFIFFCCLDDTDEEDDTEADIDLLSALAGCFI